MREWAEAFIMNQGTRLIYMLLALLIGVCMKAFTDLDGEANTIIIAVGTLCLNMARGFQKKPENGKPATQIEKPTTQPG